MTVEPSGCRACGLPERGRCQRWTKSVGWHKWLAPTSDQIKTRMLDRRAARSR